MRKHRRLFLALSLTLIVAAFFLPATSQKFVWSSSNSIEEKRLDWQRRKEQITAEKLKIENRTKALTLVSVKVDTEDNSINIKLRNDYEETVTAYEVAVANTTVYAECLTGADYNDVIQPGSVNEQVYSLQPDVDKLGIKILAAIFENGTADGDPQYINEIRQYRSGMKMQRRHSLDLLKGTLDSDTNDIEFALANIEDQLPHLSKQEQMTLPHFVSLGFADEQSRFIRLVQAIRAGNDNSQEKNASGLNSRKQMLLKVIENYTKTLSQL